jgi:hypothetical protein
MVRNQLISRIKADLEGFHSRQLAADRKLAGATRKAAN